MSFLKTLEKGETLGSVLAIAEKDEFAPAYSLARDRGIMTTGDFHNLYALPDLEAIVEVTGDDGVLEELLRTRPPYIEVIDHTRAKLIAEGQTRIGAPEHLNLFARQVCDSIGDGLAILNRDLEIVEANEAIRRLAVGKWYPCWLGKERPCPACRAKLTFETGRPRRICSERRQR